MREFEHLSSRTRADAITLHGADPATHYIAGGTTQLDLMKLNVLTPARLVDVSGLRRKAPAVVEHAGRVRIDAFATMADVAENTLLRRTMPMLTEALAQSASRQIRSMATVGGNLLQRTRCTYYRDTSWTKCNRRDPGSGCQAIEGAAPAHAVLGTSSSCIAVYPGDMAQALIALEAALEIDGPTGSRLLAVADLHLPPKDAPHVETRLSPGELIAGINIPVRAWFARSRYIKVRDRASYEFALASAAIALDLSDGMIRQVAVGLGGGATVPWRAVAAEAVLRGNRLDETLARHAADVAFVNARVSPDTRARLDLGKATMVRALLETAAMVPHG